MIDTNKMSRPEYGDFPGEMPLVCVTLRRAADIIETADRTPDENVKKPLLDGAKTMLQNVIDALDGRQSDGLVETPVDEDD